jgi:glycosyltransferase involved in cell wall biosynthesis
LRIAYVSTGLGVGGAERQVVDLADRFQGLGHEVLIVYMTGPALTLPKDPRVRIRGLGLSRASQNPFTAFHAIFRLARALREFRPDVVHGHMVHANLLVRLARPFARGFALACTAHSTNEGGRLRMLAYRVTDPLSDITTNVSQAAADAFVRMGAAARSRMVAVPNGVDTLRFAPDPVARQRVRQELSVGESERVVLAVGRLDPEKDYPTLFRAIARASVSGGPLLLWVAGAGAQGDALRALALELGIEPAVRMLGLRDDIPALMNAADVFVMSSAWEGFGLVVAEAMACGTLAVVTDSGGPPEVVGPAGMIVPTHDPVSLAGAIRSTLALDPEDAKARRQAGRRRIVERYSLDSVVARWDDIYRGLLARRTGSPPVLLIATTVPETLATILRGQPKFLSRIFSLHLMTSPGPEVPSIEAAEGVQVTCVPMTRGIAPVDDALSLLRAVGVLRRLRPRAVHSYTPKAGLVAMLAALFCRVPVRIHTFTGLLFPTERGWRGVVLRWADRLICLCATHVVPEGAGVMRDLRQHRVTGRCLEPIGHGNIAGVDCLRFRADAPGVAEAAQGLRRRLDLPGDGFVFCYIGRLNRDKGLAELAAAFERLPDAAHLIVIGALDETSPPPRHVLERLAASPRVRMVGFLADVREALAIAHVLVLPSYREGFPNVLLEAAAMSVPAVATDVSGSNEFVVPSENGWLVPPRDAQALHSAMLQAMQASPDELAQMGRRARARVVERHDRESHWQRMADFYREAIGETRR